MRDMTRASDVDVSMVRRAIKEEWELPARVREGLPALMMDIAGDTEADARARVGAGSVLVAMTRVNQADRHHADAMAQDDKHLALTAAEMVSRLKDQDLIDMARRSGQLGLLPARLREMAERDGATATGP